MDAALAGVLIAALGAVLGWLASAREHRSTVRSYEATLNQLRLEAHSALGAWARDVREWADEAIDVLATAAYTLRRGDAEQSTEEEAVLRECRARLSALIDRGRLFLPNQPAPGIGVGQPPAYQGYRHHVLDGLMAAERVIGRDAPLYEFPDRKRALIGLRREFVSAVQAIVDPASSNKDVAELLRLADLERRQDPTVGGLLPSATQPPLGAGDLLKLAARRYEAEQQRHRA